MIFGKNKLNYSKCCDGPRGFHWWFLEVSGSPELFCTEEVEEVGLVLTCTDWQVDRKSGSTHLFGFRLFVLQASLHLTKVNSWVKP